MDVASRVLEVVVGISARCASPIDVETTCREIAELVGDAQAIERERCAKMCEAIAEGHRNAAVSEKWAEKETLGAWLHAADEFAQAAVRIRGGHT
jgi:uncharacterized Fe-S center protein